MNITSPFFALESLGHVTFIVALAEDFGLEIGEKKWTA
jgi:acyl carrier protein